MGSATTLGILKQELQTHDRRSLIELCIQLARFKQENRELITYLLFHAKDPIAYAQGYKILIEEPFDKHLMNPYLLTKGIRKSFRLISRYAKVSKSKEGECELYLHLAVQFVERIQGKLVHKALITLLERALKKAHQLILKMHEDFQMDYIPIYTDLVVQCKNKVSNPNYVFEVQMI
ncbi:MAG: hypothetical protein ACK4GL_07525 [Flavobacteriales bacterium]